MTHNREAYLDERYRCPWPADIAGLLTLASGNQKGFAFAQKFCEATSEELDYLLEVRAARRWADEWALQLIERIRQTVRSKGTGRAPPTSAAR